MAEIDMAAVYQLLGSVAQGVRELRADVSELKADMRDVKRELANKADKRDVELLREEVREYHSAVVGHGILITELDERVLRVERHLDLPHHAAE